MAIPQGWVRVLTTIAGTSDFCRSALNWSKHASTQQPAIRNWDQSDSQDLTLKTKPSDRIATSGAYSAVVSLALGGGTVALLRKIHAAQEILEARIRAQLIPIPCHSEMA